MKKRAAIRKLLTVDRIFTGQYYCDGSVAQIA